MIDNLPFWFWFPVFVLLIAALVWLKIRDYKNLQKINETQKALRDSMALSERLLSFNDTLFDEALQSRTVRNRMDTTGRDTPIFDQLALNYSVYEDTK